FLLLRCQSGELPEDIGEWWTVFADASSESRTAMLLPDTGPKKRRKRPRKKASDAPATTTTSTPD
ncbi:MAG: hypothetical protein B7Y32_08800, partial [Methylophilales bacterium 16-45-7]